MWLLEVQARAQAVSVPTAPTFPLALSPQQEMLEVSELCRLFIGRRAQAIYDVSISAFVLCAAWMYATIFALSLAQTFPLVVGNGTRCHLDSVYVWEEPTCWMDYLIYIGAFFVVQVWLVMLGLERIQGVQQAFTLLGFVALFTMLGTVAGGLVEEGTSKLDEKVVLFDLSGYGKVFGTFIFAQLVHIGVPTLTRVAGDTPLLMKDVLVVVMTGTTLLYLLLGTVTALFFGTHGPDKLNKIISLNWKDYTAGHAHAQGFATVVSYAIRLYPAVTVSAAFPLYAITLGTSWYQRSQHKKNGGSSPVFTAEGEAADIGSEALLGNENGTSRSKGSSSRPYVLVATCIPMVLAVFEANVTFILTLVGFSAYVLAFFMPAALQIYSKRRCTEMFDAYETVFDTATSTGGFVACTILFGLVSLVFSLTTL